MEDGLLSLKWNNHKSTFFHILSGLRKKETYTDATIACEGKFFPVHRLVMSTCSDYFGEVFERTTCKSPVVILKDIRHHDLEALLDYMYLGEVDVKQSDLAGLIKAAECLRIKGLAVPDEDPSLTSKKSILVPETRRGSSPAAKRTRRESGGSDGVASSSYLSYGPSHKGGRRSISPSSSRSSATTSISVPSQSVVPDSLHNPASSRAIVPPSPAVADLPPHHALDVPTGEALGNTGPQSLVPVDMIKVEVEDEGGSSQPHGANSQSLRHVDTPQAHVESKDDPPGGGGSESGDRGRCGGKNGTNSFSDYSSHSNEIEKEEHDQIDAYNGAEQLAGPSGVQGAPQIMNWGDEENNFPHNLFGAEDTSQQQVCIAIMEPELLAVRMFQGPKSELANSSSLSQLRVDNNTQIVAVEQPLGPLPAPATQSPDPRKRPESHFVIYQQEQQLEQLSKSQKPQFLQAVEAAPIPSSSSVMLTTPFPAAGLTTQVISSSLQLSPAHQPTRQDDKLPCHLVDKTPSQSKKNISKPTKSIKRRKNTSRSTRVPVVQQPRDRDLCSEQVFCYRGLRFQQNANDGKRASTAVAKQEVAHPDNSLAPESDKTESQPKLVQLQNLQEEQYENQIESPGEMPGVQISDSEFSQPNQPLSDSALPQDLSSRHTKAHFCPYCHYSSKSRVDLSKHIRVHTREKPYKCPLCKYETGDKSNYKRHVSSVHKSRDPDSCTLGEQPTSASSQPLSQIPLASLPLLSPPSQEHPVLPLHPPPGGANMPGADVSGRPEPDSQTHPPLSIHAIEVVAIPYSEAHIAASPTTNSSHTV